MKHSDPKKELDLSPFRIYALIREETKHLVQLYNQLNDDPRFTFGIFHIVTIDSSIANHDFGVHNTLYKEWINVEGNPNFRDRDVIFRYYGNSFSFGSNHFMNADNPEIVKNAMYMISEDLINRMKAGVIEDLKHATGFLDSLMATGNKGIDGIISVLCRIPEVICFANNYNRRSTIVELAQKILNSRDYKDTIVLLEDIAGLNVWVELAQALNKTNTDNSLSDDSFRLFLSLGGMTSFPTISLYKSSDSETSNTHIKYSISIDGLKYPITGLQIRFQHTRVFAIYVWLLLLARETWVYTNRINDESSRKYIIALIRTLFGEHYDDEAKLVSLMTEPQEKNGKTTYQTLQDAMSSVNREIIDCFMPPKPQGRPRKGTKPTIEQKQQEEEKRAEIEKRNVIILLQKKQKRGNGRFIALPRTHIKICTEFYKEYLSHLQKDGLIFSFVKIYIPNLIEKEEWLKYISLKEYLAKGNRGPLVNLAEFGYDTEAISQYIHLFEKDTFCQACTNRRLVHKNIAGRAKNYDEINDQLNTQIETREELFTYLTNVESELSGFEGIGYRTCCAVADFEDQETGSSDYVQTKENKSNRIVHSSLFSSSKNKTKIKMSLSQTK